MKPKWEGNHNPDQNKWSVNNGLPLRTTTVTNDPHWARNTLTHRIQGPTCTATIQLDYATMRDGQQHGLPLRPFRLRRADTRRLRPPRTVRADRTPSAATFLPRI